MNMSEYKFEIYSLKRKVLEDLRNYTPSFDNTGRHIVIKNLNKKKIKELKKYCNKNNVKYSLVNTNYERGSSYRRTFFLANKPIKGTYYFCAYCGRCIPKEKITVDHIIPIYPVKNSIFKQKILKLFGINNINCEKNLTPACCHCNTKKGTKGGFWIMEGYIGKHQYLWFFRHFIRFSVLNIIIFYIFSNVFLFP